MTEDRLVDAAPAPGEPHDRALRPQVLADFVGQEQAKGNLKVFIEAARGRGEAMDHVLLFGPPGLGKTTLAQIVARELGVGFRTTSGPILYPAMEDHVLDLIIGEGPSARSVRIDLAPFTLVGATTRAGLLATPLRDRFGIPLRLEFYTAEELMRVISGAARKLGVGMTDDGAREIAGRSRGTPRVAGRLLRRVRDFAGAEEAGLDSLDRRFLRALIENYGGGPVGMDTLAAAIAEARDAVEDVIEPYLLQQGFIQRTPRGRMACARAYEHLGLTAPPAGPEQAGLFGGK